MVDFAKYGGRAAAGATAAGGGDIFARFGGRSSSAPQERVVNAQHPLLSKTDRHTINNLEDNPTYIARWLQERGFDTKVQDGEVILRKGDDPRWYKVERTGWLPNEWSDIGDLANEFTAGLAMAKGAAMAALPAGVGGPVTAGLAAMGGAAAGGAAHEAARKVAAHAAGFRRLEDIGADVADVALEGAFSAAGEGAGRVLGWGLRKAKGAISSQAAKRAGAREAIKDTPLGESAAEIAARQALAKKLAGKVPEGTNVEEVVEQYQRGQLRKEQLDEWLGVKLSPRQLRKIERSPDLLPSATEPVLGPSHWLGAKRAIESTLADYDRMTTEAAEKALDPKGKLPVGYEFAIPEKVRWVVEEGAFRIKDPSQILGLPEANLREIAAALGVRGAAPIERMGGLTRSIDEVKGDLRRIWPKVERYLVEKRHLIHTEINKAIKTVRKQRLPEPLEIVSREKATGTLRRWRVQTNAPTSSKPFTKEAIRKAAESLVREAGTEGGVNLAPLREWARRVRPKVERRLSGKKLREIDAASFEGLVHIIFAAQKAAFASGRPAYNPANYGLRWMWDLDSVNWRALALDHVRSIKRPGGQLIDFSNPAWRQAASGYSKALRGAGVGLQAAGRVVEYPAKKLEQMAEFFGLHLRGPARGLAAGATAGYATTATPGVGTTIAKTYLVSRLGGSALQKIGGLLLHDRGTLLSRLIHRAPPWAAGKLKKVMDKLGVKGEKAAALALYITLSNDPRLAEWVDEQAQRIGSATSSTDQPLPPARG